MRDLAMFFYTNLGIWTLKKKLRRHVQFVVELALVRIAQQVNVKTVKVRSDIKHERSSA